MIVNGCVYRYLELINMLLDQDKEIYPSDVQAVTKLQGFQDLTNR